MQFHAYPLIAAAMGLALATSVAAQEAQAPATADEPQTEAQAAEPAVTPNAEPMDEPEMTAPVEVEPAPDAPAAEALGSEAPGEQTETPSVAAPETSPPAATDGTDAPDAAAAGADAPDTSTGADAPDAAGDPAAGEVLETVRDTFGDWEVRCLPDGADCFMYQLALDPQQNPVAEVSLLKLPAGGEVEAGATIVTPLGTLLNDGVVIQIDGGERRSFPFNWCSQVGCFARFGLSEASLGSMKRGSKANITLVSVGAPDTPITVPLSLDGFTMAYESLEAPN